MRNIFIYGFLSCVMLHATAQETFDLGKVIGLAMQHNHGIKVAENNKQIAQNNANPGQAGLLPTISLNGGLNYSNNNTRQEFTGNFGTQEISGAQSSSDNLSLALSYTLFDGLGTFITYQKLKLNAEAVDIQARATIESTIAQVIVSFYEVTRLYNQFEIAKESANISRERFDRIVAKRDFGAASSVEYYAARVDLNTDSVALISAENSYMKTFRILNQLVGNQLTAAMIPNKEVELTPDFDRTALYAQINENNAALLNADYNLKLAELDVKLARSTELPRLVFNSSYGISESRNQAGILTYSRNLGFSGGLTLQYALFDGMKKQTAIKNAVLATQSRTEQLQDIKDQLERDWWNAEGNYTTALAILDIENRNLETAQLNFDRTKELFQLGQLTNTQFREAQLNLVNAKNRIVAAQYTTKLAEFELLRICGKLIQ